MSELSHSILKVGLVCYLYTCMLDCQLTAIAESVDRLSSYYRKSIIKKFPIYVKKMFWRQTEINFQTGTSCLENLKVQYTSERLELLFAGYILPVHRYKGLLHYTHSSRIQKMKTRETIVLQIFPLQCLFVQGS